jgi:ribose transport system ATP-binding protein
MLERVGLEIDPRVEVRTLGAAERSGIAVARALRPSSLHPTHVLVLDEPTATLPPDEVDRLLKLISVVTSSGVAVLFVTHHLEEVFRIADSVTVLRDGQVLVTTPIADVTRPSLVELLVGGEIANVARLRSELTSQEEVPILQVSGLRAGPLKAFSFKAAQGEVIGVAGLTGSGRESLLGAVFGAVGRDEGEVRVGSVEIPPRRPDLSIAARIGYLPGDRKLLGGIMSLSGRSNLTLTNLKPFWFHWKLHRREEKAETLRWFKELDVRPQTAVDRELAMFSGGNQQKILLGKWLRSGPRVLLLDEPTQGVDVGAKAEIHRHLLKLAAEGVSVVFSSTDTDELALLSHRVLIIKNGELSNVIIGGEHSDGEINRSLMSKHGSREE